MSDCLVWDLILKNLSSKLVMEMRFFSICISQTIISKNIVNPCKGNKLIKIYSSTYRLTKEANKFLSSFVSLANSSWNYFS